MQERAHKNFEASRDRSLPVFGVGVVFIDESAVLPIPSHEMEEAVEAIGSVVSSLAPPRKELHLVPIETVYSSDSIDGKQRLTELMNEVSDPTGREDMLLCLRMLALQKVASEFGYNRIVLRSCISRIAAHVISATVKGQGYTLPADIQYVDDRWEIPVVLPLRDCFAQEINMLCHLGSLKTIKLSTGPRTSINNLVSSFVALLQEENPSRESTIIRTAGKLIPFQFNRIQEIIDGNVPLATRRRQKRYNLNSNDSVSSESFCSLCNSPLDKSEIVDWSNHDSCNSSDVFYTSCCSSCQFQILPQDSTSVEKFHMDLPHSVVARAKHANNSNSNVLSSKVVVVDDPESVHRRTHHVKELEMQMCLEVELLCLMGTEEDLMPCPQLRRKCHQNHSYFLDCTKALVVLSDAGKVVRHHVKEMEMQMCPKVEILCMMGTGVDLMPCPQVWRKCHLNHSDFTGFIGNRESPSDLGDTSSILGDMASDLPLSPSCIEIQPWDTFASPFPSHDGLPLYPHHLKPQELSCNRESMSGFDDISFLVGDMTSDLPLSPSDIDVQPPDTSASPIPSHGEFFDALIQGHPLPPP